MTWNQAVKKLLRINRILRWIRSVGSVTPCFNEDRLNKYFGIGVPSTGVQWNRVACTQLIDDHCSSTEVSSHEADRNPRE